jgi:hypothetical protein
LRIEERIISRRRPDYQGVALRWENAWAFGPAMVRPACLETCAPKGCRFTRRRATPRLPKAFTPHHSSPLRPSAQRAERSPTARRRCHWRFASGTRHWALPWPAASKLLVWSGATYAMLDAEALSPLPHWRNASATRPISQSLACVPLFCGPPRAPSRLLKAAPSPRRCRITGLALDLD